MEKLAELAKLVEDLHTNLKRAKDQMESTETTAENSYVPAISPDKMSLLQLNDDCLLKIMSFLKMDDLVSLHLVHSRFRPLFPIATKKLYKGLTVDRKKLLKYPLSTSMDRYRVLGEIVNILKFDGVIEMVVTALLPHFPHIDELSLSVPTLKDIEAIKTFPIPKKLELDVKKADQKYMDALFLRFSSRLEELDCKDTPNADFGMLSKVTDLEIDAVWLGRKSKFWKNAKHLTRLHMQNEEDRMNPWDLVEVNQDYKMVQKNLQDIANIESLDDLNWLMIGTRNLRANCIPEFRHPTQLNLDFTDHHIILPVIRKLGPQVKSFQITHNEVTEDRMTLVAMLEVIGKNLPNLELLHMCLMTTFTEIQVRPLMALKKLRDIIFNIDLTPKIALKFVKVWPELIAIPEKLSGTDEKKVISKELIRFLQKENRSVWFGRKQIPRDFLRN